MNTVQSRPAWGSKAANFGLQPKPARFGRDDGRTQHRGDPSTINSLVICLSPVLFVRLNRRKCAVSSNWQMVETYIKVRGDLYLIEASTVSAVR